MVGSGEEKSQCEMLVGVFETPWEPRDMKWNFSKVLGSKMPLPSRHRDNSTRPRTKYKRHLHTNVHYLQLLGQEGGREGEKKNSTNEITIQ